MSHLLLADPVKMSHLSAGKINEWLVFIEKHTIINCGLFSKFRSLISAFKMSQILLADPVKMSHLSAGKIEWLVFIEKHTIIDCVLCFKFRSLIFSLQDVSSFVG